MMNSIDNKYKNVLHAILNDGYEYEDPNRKGVKRKEISTVFLEHYVFEGYPIVSVRKTFFKGAVGELLLFLKGENDIRKYWDYGIYFWDKDFKRFHNYNDHVLHNLKHIYETEPANNNVKDWYSLGEIYPKQYSKQYHVFDKFKENPLRTDLVVDAWQVEDLDKMALIPCHFGFQILGSEEGFQICWFQRSTDFLLGSPINIQYYFLMGVLLEKWSGHKFLGIKGILNKCHLYDNQFELAQKMIEIEEPHEFISDPNVIFEFNEDYKDLKFEEFIKKITPKDFKLKNYKYIIDETAEMLTYDND